jgi:hypothetical protein
VGKIQEIEYTFSAAKEKVYSPMILKPTWYLTREKKSFPVNLYFLEID